MSRRDVSTTIFLLIPNDLAVSGAFGAAAAQAIFWVGDESRYSIVIFAELSELRPFPPGQKALEFVLGNVL